MPGSVHSSSEIGPLLLSPEEASRVLGISRSKLYQLMAKGEIPSITVGRSRRVPTAELRGWLAGRIEAEYAGRPDRGGRV